jgi:hypothetical protein
MLGGQPGGQLSLANAVPPDRFFVYVAKPEAILPFLDKGAGFAAAAGAGWTGNRLDYDLTRRYLQRLGISRSWLEAVLKSGVLQDMAVVLPDLLLIDGTDITVVARLKQPELLAALLPLAGIQGLTPDGVSTVKTSGRETSWALRGDLLCISSHRSELDGVLRLIAADGVGSLGRSDEFRYMLTQVPVNPQTRMLAYFSDSFVRRIVGPEVKLGQLRRVQARAQMELLTSQSLLARLDGVIARRFRRRSDPHEVPAGRVSSRRLLDRRRGPGPIRCLRFLGRHENVAGSTRRASDPGRGGRLQTICGKLLAVLASVLRSHRHPAGRCARPVARTDDVHSAADRQHDLQPTAGNDAAP